MTTVAHAKKPALRIEWESDLEMVRRRRLRRTITMEPMQGRPPLSVTGCLDHSGYQASNTDHLSMSDAEVKEHLRALLLKIEGALNHSVPPDRALLWVREAIGLVGAEIDPAHCEDCRESAAEALGNQ